MLTSYSIVYTSSLITRLLHPPPPLCQIISMPRKKICHAAATVTISRDQIQPNDAVVNAGKFKSISSRPHSTDLFLQRCKDAVSKWNAPCSNSKSKAAQAAEVANGIRLLKRTQVGNFVVLSDEKDRAAATRRQIGYYAKKNSVESENLQVCSVNHHLSFFYFDYITNNLFSSCSKE